MPAKKMVNLSIEETSGVDHPAHLAEGWVILKRADRAEVAGTISALIKEEQPMTDENVDVTVSDELAKANERIAELESQIADLQAATAPSETSDEALIKSAPPAVREMLEKARAEADQVREELRKERDAQRDREFVEKAKGWQHLAIDADSFGPVLRRLFDLAPEIGAVMEKALTAADAQAESGAIFQEIGKSAPVAEGGDTYGRLQSLAKAAVERGDYSTVEQAVTGLVTANPDLYNEYLASRG